MTNEVPYKPKIMIVDDDQETINLIMHILKKEFLFESAYDGQAAMSKISVFQPDILLSDITMPHMDGFQLVKWVRDQNEFKNLKIIFISGLGDLADRIKGYEAGADDFIPKPFKALELLAKVKNFAKMKKAEDELISLNKNLEVQIKLRSEQLLQSEKLAVLGRNTAGIIHNLNNPLCAILGISTLLKEKLPNDTMVDILTKATNKMQEIVGCILKSTRSRHNVKFKAININELLLAEIKLTHNSSFCKGIKIETNFGIIPDVQGIESDFSQIFSNPIDNAIQSMINRPEKTLKINTAFVNNSICVTIIDTGCGIPSENITKIFDPFFTTKPSISKIGEPTGTGLGMPTCKAMLEAYNGKMEIDSIVNVGTKISLFIPVANN